MGINGLLPLLKSIHKSCHLRNYEGKTLGVDAYGWLHRGVVACAMELATGKPTRRFVDFAMHRVRMLQHFGVNPLLVFDGDNLPSKAATEQGRAKRREEHRKLGRGFLNDGKLAQAYHEFQKSLDVTPEMARQLIDELRKFSVQYIVAPYEADCQMVYLETKGIISGILSEDSDLLVFGAKCLLTKLDQYGNCIEINKADFSACKDINLTGWSDTAFRQMAILSGCDYLPNITNMGLKTAYRMIRRYKNIEKVIQMLQFDGKFRVPQGYLESFYQAELTFLHQRVFCPQTLGLVLHTQPMKPINLDNMPFIGAFVDSDTAQGVARGDLHPMTKSPFIVSDNTLVPLSIHPWSITPLSKKSTIHTKQESSITNFFSKRSPLNELDLPSINSSLQDRLLEKNPKPRSCDQSSHSCIFQGETKVNHLSKFASKEINENFNIPKASSLQGRDSVKRARLCADTTSHSSSDFSKFHSSPYFSPSFHKNRNSFKKNVKIQQKETSDNYLFSDDSIEDAMLVMSNIGEDTIIQPCSKNIISTAQESGEDHQNKIRPMTSQDWTVSPTNLEDTNSSLPPQSIKSLANSPPTPPKENPNPSNSPVNRIDFKVRSTPKFMVKSIDTLTPESSAQSEEFKFLPKIQTSKLHLSSKITKKRLESRHKFSPPMMNLMQLPFKLLNTLDEISRPVKSRISCPEQTRTTLNLSSNLNQTHLSTLNDFKNVFQNTSTGSEDLIIPDSEEEPLSPVFTGKLTDYFR